MTLLIMKATSSGGRARKGSKGKLTLKLEKKKSDRGVRKKGKQGTTPTIYIRWGIRYKQRGNEDPDTKVRKMA